ncbi:MAG TPA: UDP-4-amino-4,6-dideoxy-N-acetyl-beta-L-altrosamine transaminase [Ignavibacteria bacterium]|nr:UDP-4-amino-4,6-dideoxy-N-acetyl-beta-L-altrosamine transaminase [Ignavibacteria bacterium]
MMEAIPYGKQNIIDADIQNVVEVLKSKFLTQGPKIDEFENKFSEYVGCKYSTAVANGTAGLHVAAMALGVKPGTKVITTPITFCASANCILYCGGEVDFVDIDFKTYTIDLNKLEDLLKSKPAGYYQGVVPVDFAGLAVNLEELKKITDKYNLWILEDACHSPAAYFIDSKGQKQFAGNGKFADVSVFSFHPVKHITSGEGGMITTNNPDIDKKAKQLRTHGITKIKNDFVCDDMKENGEYGGWYYEMQELGYNYRLTDIQAVLGMSQLSHSLESLKKRKELVKRYDEAFKPYADKIKTPYHDDGHAFHLYVIQVEKRKELYDYLVSNNIYPQVHYAPVHLLPYYRNFGWKKGDFPIAESYYSKCLSIPMYPTLTNEQQNYVIEKIIKFINK